MSVTYPHKFQSQMGALSGRDILCQIVRDRSIHMVTLNRYRYNEQNSCKGLTSLIELLNGQPPQLIQELSRHVSDEARHALWLTELLIDLGESVGTPPGVSYVDEFERLLDAEQVTPEQKDEFLISTLAAINTTEKRGCEYFSAHIYALKQLEQTTEQTTEQAEETRKIRETIERILPEEAAHVRWGTRWLAQLAKQSPQHRQMVETAKRKYAAIEQAAFESGFDFMLGAELRRMGHLLDIANMLPVWQRPQYLLDRLPQTLFSPALQQTRLMAAQRAWQKDPQMFMEKFVPMFLSGLTGNFASPKPSASPANKV